MKKNTLAMLTIAAAFAAAMFTIPIHAHGQADVNHSTEIRIDNFKFTPETITVPVNSQITWINKDDVPHVIAANNGAFKSKALDTDDTYSYSFAKPGSYEYFCAVHPKMVGKVVVK
jgi:plastocyanin